MRILRLRCLLLAVIPLVLKGAPETRTTTGGATFTVPEGWSVKAGATVIILDPPEVDSHIAIAEVAGMDSEAAVAAAWVAYRPEARRILKLSTSAPPRNGWDESRNFSYETSPNERAVVEAIARRAGKSWIVIITDATESTYEKRNAPISIVIESLRPKGYQRETFAGRPAAALNPQRIGQIKSFLRTSMRELGIPGVSFALIDRGKVVYEGGLGVRELGKAAAVDKDTLFMAASNTKGMSTLLLARMVDEKKVRWNQPVTEVYPDFRLGSAEITRKVQIRDLVCACTGLPRQDYDWIFEFKNSTPESTIQLLGAMQPTSGFGEAYQYSNTMAAAAGYIAGHLYRPDKPLGTAYDEAMQKEIFDPLGMNSTTFSFARALKGNHASPHGDDIDGQTRLNSMDINYSMVAARPAGGVWTSAHDLIRYVLLELNRGNLSDGTRLVSEENLLARRVPRVSIGENETYGMGLKVDNTWGVPVVHHSGSMMGYKSDLFFLPDHGIGAVLLANSDNGWYLLQPFMRRLLEVTFDGKPQAAEDVESVAARTKQEAAKERERLTFPPDPAQVARLAKHYTSTALGDIDVRKQGSMTVFDFGEWKSAVATRKNDDGTVSFITADPALVGAYEFITGDRDGKRVLTIRDAQHEYVFTETAA